MNKESQVKIDQNGIITAVKNKDKGTILEMDEVNIKVRFKKKNHYLNLFKFTPAYINLDFYTITEVIFFETPKKRGKVTVYYTNGDEDFELEGIPSEDLISYLEGEI